MFLATAGLGFVATLDFLDRKNAPIQTVDVGAASGPTRCEVELGPERCPGLLTFEPAKLFRTFSDDREGSGKNMERCLTRATEFRGACGGKSPVTARFYRGNQVVRAQTAP
jgi:hypothetical protein